MIKEAISKIVKNQDLTESEMIEVMNEIMTGAASPGQIGAFITALRIKGETVTEITGAAKVMREKATKIDVKGKKVVDTCGTGGDESMTFNISTAAAFVAAGAELIVAKHGNRSVSSRSGSADVLKALGVNIEAEVARVEECLKEIGIGFLFAPMLHGAMKYAAPVRREIGIRTIFNILGPLTNPAGARCQVIGVYDDSLTDILGKVLSNLGAEHAFVVRGEDGLDEITLTTETKVTELKEGKLRTYHIKPEDFGFRRCRPEDLKGGDPEMNADIIRSILKGKKGPQQDVVVLNAAAAIVAGGMARSLEEGILAAVHSIDEGKALEKLNKLVEMTNP
ncbi:MAG TPA: anthranilate phosphoribosyltransferase [Deltaproteobacteria bacterium]|nr:MAG: anthranilate phosphoribosyltransferase [Deltaproteobacteria bacterium GWD2_42_10]OGQ26167.1 MAG: anthranilate phosphoribosyltransferase [Deltaproteobacteria bacterium RIFCSPHIGHO2_02_FULL_42_44]OGQ36921.1 MAG: anthranilate phosphoribosyltransferase [Deltaproteobacteria bacterium RIFCSPLOWO2_02_FULL_42_39]OGQ69107.1 MAG: anthranilate phosphoribosyltransferase [Deltaproteobacteria bacterium RIFCSPLOWO2_12_FULL_42_16]OGQ72422.1 MAG: anthranilate phosphoribosyltransferase [Deltaproteobacter